MESVDILILNLDKMYGNRKLEYILQILEYLKTLFNKEFFTEEDKKFIVEFIDKGLFNKIIALGLDNSDIRINIFDISKQYQNNDTIRKKAPELVSFFNGINNDFLIEYINVYITDDIAIDKGIKILEDFLNSGLEYINQDRILDIVKKIAERNLLKYFRKGSLYSIILNELKLDKQALLDKNDRTIEAEKRINSVKKFINNYLFYALLRREELNLEDDELLNNFSDLQENFKNIKNPKNNKDISIETLIFVNEQIAKLIKNAHDNPNYVFSHTEKYFLNLYIKRYYRTTLENFSELEKNGHIEIFIELANVFKNGFGLTEANDVFLKMFNRKRFEKTLIQNSDNFTSLNLLADISLKNISIFQEFISNNQNPYESECINTYIRNIIDWHAKSNKKDITNKHYQLVVEYVNSITQKSNFNIFTDQYISDIMQLSYSKSIPDTIRKKINNVLERNLHLSEINIEQQTDILDKVIENNGIIYDEKIIDEFFFHLGKIKLKGNRIDTKYIEFAIKQVLDQNSAICKNPEKYSSYIYRIIEELGRNDISLQTSSNQYCFFIRDFLRDNTTYGHILNNIVTIRRDQIDNLINHRDIRIFNFIFHENTHAKQNQEIKKKSGIDYYRYLMLKEEILILFDKNYYTENYWDFFEEIEAREQGALRTKKFLSELIMPLTEDEKESCCDSLIDSLFSELKEKANQEKRNYKKARIKINTLSIWGGPDKIEDIFDELLCKHPTILNNPEFEGLFREYNQDGTKKRISQILPDIEKTKGNKDLHLYMNILIRGNIFKFKNIVEDLQYLINHETNDKRSCWINSEILKHLLQFAGENINKIQDNELPQFVKIIEELNTKRNEVRNKPEKDRTYSDKKILMAVETRNEKKDKATIDFLLEVRQKLIDEKRVSVLDIEEEQKEPLINEETKKKAESKDEANTDSPEIRLFHEADENTSQSQKVTILNELIANSKNSKVARNTNDNNTISLLENDEMKGYNN